MRETAQYKDAQKCSISVDLYLFQNSILRYSKETIFCVDIKITSTHQSATASLYN